MAITVENSGTYTTNPGTEEDLDSVTGPGIYQLEADINAITGDEIITLRVYKKVLSGGTERLEEESSWHGIQGIPIVRMPPIVIPHNGASALRFTAEQTGGSARSMPWSVNKIA